MCTKFYLLIIQHDVRKPDFFCRYIKTIYSVVPVWIPHQLVIEPFLQHVYQYNRIADIKYRLLFEFN